MSIVGQLILRTRNVGDFVSAPSRYFDIPGLHLMDMRDTKPKGTDAVIYGGGALGLRFLRHSVLRRTAPRVTIAWGVGTSIHGSQDVGEPADWLTLYGSREWQQPNTVYAPCASCMSHLFDKDYSIEHDAVVYYNKDPRVGRPAISGLPVMHNENPFKDAIRFIASGETVITNSYHGAYWASLLGRKVVVIDAYSSKFYGYKFPPVHASVAGWRRAAKEAIAYPEALDDARSANRAFYSRVMNLLGAR